MRTYMAMGLDDDRKAKNVMQLIELEYKSLIADPAPVSFEYLGTATEDDNGKVWYRIRTTDRSLGEPHVDEAWFTAATETDAYNLVWSVTSRRDIPDLYIEQMGN